MANPHDVWERARRGRHAVLLGLPISEPPQDLRVVRVSCDIPPSTLGPLLEARSRIEKVLGASAPLVEMARTRVMTGLRRHLLGDLLTMSSDGSLVDVCNRFAALEPSVLVLEAADAADPASLDMLRHILGRAGWLRLPVLLTMRAGPLPAAASVLVEAVRAAYGDEAILGEPAGDAADGGPEAPARPAPAPEASLDLRAIPADVLRVLRALAIAGSGCEAPILALALEMSEFAVLDSLQRAVDGGVPVEDRGEGRFHLPPHVIATLRASVLPSLATALHRRVASIVAKELPPETPAVPALQVEAPESITRESPRPGDAWEVMQAEPPATMRLPGSEASPAAASQPGEEAEEQAAPRQGAAARAVEETLPALEAAPRGVDEAVVTERFAAQRAAEEAVARAMEEAAALAAQEAAAHAVQQAAARAADQAAEEAAAEAAALAAIEARREAEAAAVKDAEARREAEAAAAQAVDQARRELSEPSVRVPAYFKPFTGQTRPPDASRSARWSQSRKRDSGPARPAPEGRVASMPSEARGGADGAASEDRPSEPPRLSDDARAARHLAAAGDAEAAIERYFEAMGKAAAAAAYPQAVAHARSALALLERLPPSEARRLQRVRLLLQTARVLWHGAGPDDSFTLPGALRVIESARALVHAGDPVELIAEIAITIAGILDEIGDVASLSRALDELANASRLLAEAGKAQEAARLLNDQASVLIGLGDPVRAAHLLTESRKVFETASKTDPVAMIEMAETDHHFARILLHVPARPGREGDALSMGLDHAMASERAFRRLGAPREVGRVLETMGRIELRKGRLSRAADRLTSALQIQESIGDVVGLARSTAALSEVLAAGGRVHEALNLLADSIVLNFEKGSPLGVAFNRRALQALAESEAVRRSAPELLGEAAARLAAAEKVVGRVPIPGGKAEAA